MRRLLLLGLLPACAFTTFALPQPSFSTEQPDGAIARAVAAVREHCGGVRAVNEEAGVVIAPWQVHTVKDERDVFLTQCLVTVLGRERSSREIRLTFAARRCPPGSDAELESALPGCEVLTEVPLAIHEALGLTARRLQADIAR